MTDCTCGKIREEDGSIEALYHRTDGDSETIRELMRRMRIIYESTAEDVIRAIVYDALRMSWLCEEP